MTLTLDQLYDALPVLKTKWNDTLDYTSVSELDHFYSDGVSRGAILKIILRYQEDPTNIQVVFIFPDGEHSHVFGESTNCMMSDWITGILKKSE